MSYSRSRVPNFRLCPVWRRHRLPTGRRRTLAEWLRGIKKKMQSRRTESGKNVKDVTDGRLTRHWSPLKWLLVWKHRADQSPERKKKLFYQEEGNNPNEWVLLWPRASLKEGNCLVCRILKYSWKDTRLYLISLAFKEKKRAEVFSLVTFLDSQGQFFFFICSLKIEKEAPQVHSAAVGPQLKITSGGEMESKADVTW